MLVLRDGIVGVTVDDTAGGGDDVWEQAISELKQRFPSGHWEVCKGEFCSRVVAQAADGGSWASATWRSNRGGTTRHAISVGSP